VWFNGILQEVPDDHNAMAALSYIKDRPEDSVLVPLAVEGFVQYAG
jgi:hypothetical protein